jgi:hypothetical protein
MDDQGQIVSSNADIVGNENNDNELERVDSQLQDLVRTRMDWSREQGRSEHGSVALSDNPKACLTVAQ